MFIYIKVNISFIKINVKVKNNKYLKNNIGDYFYEFVVRKINFKQDINNININKFNKLIQRFVNFFL